MLRKDPGSVFKPMSAIGPKRNVRADAFRRKADMTFCGANVRL